jgi:hypothetical protein
VKFSLEFGAAIKLETWRSAINQISIATGMSWPLSPLRVETTGQCQPEVMVVVKNGQR